MKNPIAWLRWAGRFAQKAVESVIGVVHRFRNSSSRANVRDQQVPLPQGMMRLSLEGFRRRHSPVSALAIAAQAVSIGQAKGNRAANDFLLEQIGMAGSIDRNDSYFADALHYHLGLLHAHAFRPEEMADHIRASRTMPGSEDDQLFSDHVNFSSVVRFRQLAGIERGLPPILIAGMPRSASASLSYTLAKTLDIPVMRLSVGHFPNCFLAPSWLGEFLQGGAITQDHFGASPFNIDVLGKCGVRDVFVLVRDPRAAARSHAHFFLAYNPKPQDEPLEIRIEREFFANFLPWLQQWVECAENKELPFRIHWITYQEATQDPAGVLRRISAVLGTDQRAAAAFAGHQSVEEVRMHFVSGRDREWQAEVSNEIRERFWEACTPEMKALLKLEF